MDRKTAIHAKMAYLAIVRQSSPTPRHIAWDMLFDFSAQFQFKLMSTFWCRCLVLYGQRGLYSVSLGRERGGCQQHADESVRTRGEITTFVCLIGLPTFAEFAVIFVIARNLPTTIQNDAPYTHLRHLAYCKRALLISFSTTVFELHVRNGFLSFKSFLNHIFPNLWGHTNIK